MSEKKRIPQVLSPEAPVVVKVNGITKMFSGLKALDAVSFEIKQGEILGFLGPNGAGKTTAMRVLTGFFPPTRGSVQILGKDLNKKPKEVKKRIGYLPESVPLYRDMRVQEFLQFAAAVKKVPFRRRRSHIDDKLTRCGLWDVRRRLIGQLSKGYRQRVGLAQALIGDPEVLVLDEPTSGLDPKQIIEIRSLIRELGRDRSVILSTHILPEVSMVCDRVIIINQGRLVAQGTTDELEADLKDRHEVFLVMGDSHRKEDAVDLLKSLHGVERVTVAEEKNNQVSFSLAVAKGEDLRPVISRLFVEHQIPLLELRSGRLSLEEIFMKLVVEEKQGASPS